jgi:hypothetical protein
MFIECTAACNMSCNQACCAPETGITRTRQAGMLDFGVFTKVIDEVGPSLGRIDFFNYGEAFLHKRAVEMVEYIKSNHPHIYVYTSTNGTAFNEAQARRLVHSGIDEVTFSIDGARAESYVKYRQRGRFDVAIENLRAMVDEKTKSGATCRTSTGATSSSNGTTATRRWSWPAGWRRRSASIASAGKSRTIRKTRSRGASSAARQSSNASVAKRGTTAILGMRSRARPRGRRSPCRSRRS